jgi:hypothetical protein
MNSARLKLSDPFATLVELTAGALNSRPRASAEARAPAQAPARSLLDRLDAWLWQQRQRELERALADSTDVYEVERRLRGEVSLFHRYI